jgi:hypothetical protein
MFKHCSDVCHSHSKLYQFNAEFYSYVCTCVCLAGSASYLLEREEDNKTRYESDGSTVCKQKLNMARGQEKCD